MLLPILCLAFHRVCLPLVYSYFVSTHCTPYAWLLLSILSFSCLACRPQFTTLFPQANHPARVQDDRQRIGQTPFRIHEMAKIGRIWLPNCVLLVVITAGLTHKYHIFTTSSQCYQGHNQWGKRESPFLQRHLASYNYPITHVVCLPGHTGFHNNAKAQLELKRQWWKQQRYQ